MNSLLDYPVEHRAEASEDAFRTVGMYLRAWQEKHLNGGSMRRMKRHNVEDWLLKSNGRKVVDAIAERRPHTTIDAGGNRLMEKAAGT